MIRIIGLGSPYGDDQAGWDVITRIGDGLPPQVEAIALDRPGAALINWIRDCRRVVLIDAVLDPTRVGQFSVLDEGQRTRSQRAFSSHSLELDETLQLAATLNASPERIDIYGIFISQVESKSQTVSDVSSQLAARLRQEFLANPR